ncbi:ribbon-helix-helix domain-containing protein [Bacillus salipaludis]|uniref:Ribbon-helix-helix domain-containing protein n=1 Tax=Bacillus salipaludis TaxID=2547811 RepID=A0AA90Z5F3_9BACI|nr:ribbon-helix-helix domain-containing protein [Bacillus salipaludis]MDQ6600907.1 ribbon-helix-helix domain-containing protein [Bacillus salipaludis]
MSAKNNLKDRIKKPNATSAFFNSYDTNNDVANNLDDNETKIIDNNENKYKNDDSNKSDDINDVKEDNNVIATKNNNIKTYVEDDNEIDNVVVDKDDDYLRELATGKKPSKKKNKKVFTSFYMDPDLASEVDKIAARGEKGDKSKLINMAIRKLLEEYGVIEKK